MALGVLLAYGNSFSVPLLLDDHTTIANNPSIRQLWPFASVLFPPVDMFSAGRPLLNLSFALNYAIGGTNVTGYHVVNLAIHLAAGFALFGLVQRTLLRPAFAARFGPAATSLGFAIALLWLLHPVQTISVTYLSQRAESLMGLCYLLTLYTFVRGATTKSSVWLTGSFAACACGMATKEVMVTAPVVVLLYDRQFISGSFRAAWQHHRGYYCALAATWLVLAGLMVNSRIAQRGIGARHGVGVLEYLRIECVAVVKYLQLLFWPHPLVFDYGPQVAVPSGVPLFSCAIVILALVGGSLVLLWRAHVLGFASAGFFLLLAPTSSLVPVAGQPIAESRLYLPLAFVAATTVLAGYAVAPRRVSLYAGVVMLAAFGSLTHRRNTDFQSEIGIWQDTVAKHPTNVRAWSHLSLAQESAGRLDAAIKTALAAIARIPNRADLHNNAGIYLSVAGRKPEAIAQLRTAVRLAPDNVMAYHSLGRLLVETGDLAGAQDCYEAVLRIDPANAKAHNYLGVILARTGRATPAISHFEAALKSEPEFREAQKNLEAARQLIR